MKLENPQDALKLRLILDKFSAELFINDGCQTFSTTFYTPLEADGMDKLAELPQDYVFLNIFAVTMILAGGLTMTLYSVPAVIKCLC